MASRGCRFSEELYHDNIVKRLHDSQVRPQLEGILEEALREQPRNVVRFMVERLCKVPSSEACGIGIPLDDLAAEATGEPATTSADTPAADVDPELAIKFFEAVSSGDVDSMTEFLNDGVPVNLLNEDGCTALHIAVEGEQGCVEVCTHT